MKLNKKEIESLHLEINDNGGFTLWCKEKIKIKGKMTEVSHWLIDASCIKDDLQIRLGQYAGWKLSAEYNEAENSIEIVKQKPLL
jgi:hypothetical protein